MKRLFSIGLMLVSAFALTNCAEEIAAPVQDDITVDGNIENITPPEEEVNIPFEVFATVGGEADTKTVNWGNATYWHKYEEDGDAPSDQISVFHHNGKSLTRNKEFTIYDVENGLFKGALTDVLGATNDWYFIYPYKSDYTVSSSSGPTLTVKGVQIGAQTINQTLINTIDKNITLAANSKAYICNKLSPMFGHLPNRPRNEQPEIEMKHLAAIVAIKVVNDGFGGDIKIKDVEFAVPDVYKTDNNGKVVTDDNGNPTKLQDAFPIVGQFDVNMANGQCTAIVGNSYASTKFELPTAVTLRKNESMTFYLPLMPFSATKTISIKVNGSERAISKAVKLESGKVATFRVPVKTLEAKDVLVENGVIMSDAFRITSIGRTTTGDSSHTTGNANNIVVTTNVQPKTIKVNGQDVEAYILGSADGKSTGTITVTGFLKDLINALPIRFYVSTWNNNPAVMTVNKVSAWIPVFGASETRTSSKNTSVLWREENWDVVTDYSTITKRAGAKSILAGGVMGKDVAVIERWMLNMLGTGVESKITFSNISQNGYFENNNIIVLNEGFAQKEINDNNLNTFLASFSTGSGANKKTATAEGLRKIANSDFETLPMKCVYKETRTIGRLTEELYSVTPLGLDTDWPVDKDGKCTVDPDIVNTIEGIWGKVGGIDIANLVKVVDEIPNKFHLLHMLRDVKVSVELGTTSAGPCIVFWGFDATTETDRNAVVTQ